MVDGVGVGRNDPAVNPLAGEGQLLSRFDDGTGEPLPGGGAAGEADAALGVPGRPQSATGHTTLLTGTNAPAHLGKHLLGFPNAPLRALLADGGVFGAARRAGRRAAYANAYACAYLDVLGLPHVHAAAPEPPLPARVRRLRPSASTVAAAGAGLELRTFEHLRRGEAVFHDVTGELPRSFGADVPLRSEEEAAAALLGIAAAHDLTMFEFFQSDEAGHGQYAARAKAVLGKLDRLLRALVARLPPGGGLLVTSDHGNVEDLSSRQHTRNPVPVLGFGTAAAEVSSIRSLVDVGPALLRLSGAS